MCGALAEGADRAIRMNPSFPTAMTGMFAYPYFMAGRYADALCLEVRVAPEARARTTGCASP
jgi:hypothetical protein